jgi:hypothetical protein
LLKGGRKDYRLQARIAALKPNRTVKLTRREGVGREERGRRRRMTILQNKKKNRTKKR